MSTVKENLIAARALIDTPEKWVQGYFAFEGCYCALGAIEKVTNDLYYYRPEITDALAAGLPTPLPDLVQTTADDWDSAGGRSKLIHRFNDHPDTTHADIMALFDRAIAAQDGAS